MIKLLFPLLLAAASAQAQTIRIVPITRNPVSVFPDGGFPARLPSVAHPLARIPSPISPIPSIPWPARPAVTVAARIVAVPVATPPSAPLALLPAARAKFAPEAKGLSIEALNQAFEKVSAPVPEPPVVDVPITLPEQDLEREIGI